MRSVKSETVPVTASLDGQVSKGEIAYISDIHFNPFYYDKEEGAKTGQELFEQLKEKGAAEWEGIFKTKNFEKTVLHPKSFQETNYRLLALTLDIRHYDRQTKSSCVDYFYGRFIGSQFRGFLYT